jgi:hypothetical protein
MTAQGRHAVAIELSLPFNISLEECSDWNPLSRFPHRSGLSGSRRYRIIREKLS